MVSGEIGKHRHGKSTTLYPSLGQCMGTNFHDGDFIASAHRFG